MRLPFTSGLLTIAVLAAAIRSAGGQTTIYDWVPTGTGDWNVDANWVGLTLNFVPDADSFVGEVANIDNGGTAIAGEAVPRVAGITVSNGAIEIQNGGELNTVNDGVGDGSLSIGGAGAVRLSGNGQLVVDGNVTNAGTLRLDGPGALVEVAGDFATTGTLVAGITDAASHSTINVDGNAELDGSLQVEFTGVTPDFGQSWDLINAGSLEGRFSAVNAVDPQALSRGLRVQVAQDDSTASLTLGNTLILTVDRQTGEGTIENAVGAPIEITGYAIHSDRGLLSANDWTSAADSNAAGAGWREANPSVNHLAELNLTDSFTLDVGQTLDLGNPYSGGPSKPFEEDVAFEYTTPDGRLEQGIVEYRGAVNDFTLFVDPDSGEAALGNLSRFIETPVITSYAVLSASASLTPDSWVSFADSGEAGEGWRTANPDSEHIAELNLTESATFPNGTLISLGDVFSPGAEQDLVLQYSTPDGELLTGFVQYGEIPVPMVGDLPGDYNGNGLVEQGDLDLVLLNWGDDADTVPDTWVNDMPSGIIDQMELDGVLLNWGNAAAAGGVSSAAVPEPATCLLAFVLAIIVGATCVRRFEPARRRSLRTAKPRRIDACAIGNCRVLRSLSSWS